VENRKKTAAMLEKLQPIAEAYKLTVAQLVIAWTLARPCLTHVLCGARNAQQAAENAASGEADLDSETIAAIDAILEESGLTLPHPFK
jgi:aryl-alcohol dehydrogenase-like predicted oxidoreductase